MIDRLGVVFAKEVLDNLRDRRTITGGLVGALLGPLLILMMVIIIGQAFGVQANERPLDLALVGAENAPGLVDYLRRHNVHILPAPADPQAAVRTGQAGLVVIIPPGYAAAFASGQAAPVQLVLDPTRQSTVGDVERARSLLRNYSAQIGALRLLARGISPSIAQALALEEVDVSTPQSQVLIFLNMLPYFLIFTIFSGGMAVIIDATAGERERNSLEPLLINPAPRSALVLGKLLAALPFSAGMLLLTLAAFAFVFNVVPLEEIVGLRFSLDIGRLVVVYLLCLPMILLASSVQMIVATFSRSFKEAQTYVGFLPLLPALPGIGLAFLPVRAEVWYMLIPTFGQQILINQVMRGEPLSALNVLVSAGVTLLVSAGLVLVAIRLYLREQILFGRTG